MQSVALTALKNCIKNPIVSYLSRNNIHILRKSRRPAVNNAFTKEKKSQLKLSFVLCGLL